MARFLATEPLLTKRPSPASGGGAGGAAGREGLFIRLTPLFAALLFAYPAMQAHRAHAEDTPASSQNSLPDLGRPSDRSGNVSVRPSGVALESTFDRNKVVIAPEYSNQTGLSIGAALATMLGDNAAIGVVLTAGSDKKELLVNAGFKLDEHQRFILTAGQLEQFLDYAFLSGTEKVGVTQNSGGVSYQLQLGQEFLRFLEINGYVARTASRDLTDKTFAIDTATLYELWNDPRRIAGGKVTGLQGRLGFAPLEGSLVKVSLGQERLSYDFLAGEDNTHRLTAGVEWTQQLGSGYSLKAAADTFASQNRYTLGLDRSLAGNGGRHNLGVSLVSLRGRDGLGDDSQIKLTYSYAFGSSGGRSATAHGPTANAAPTHAALPTGENLLNQIALRPGFIPSHVIARIDNTAMPTRLIAVDKTALPAGTSIDTASGDVTAPLGVAVTGIAGVTRNNAAFTNTGQFSLAGNSIVIKPSLIVQPAVGITDTYVVTLNNLGGGTTLVTVLVSHGSIKIDSITVTVGAVADVAAPTTTAAPSVSGTTDTATTLSATINENGTGYYLVQTAAAGAPSVAAVQAGTSFAMTANVAATPAISGLTAATAYKIYFVAKDVANNVQSAVSSVAVTTTAAPDITAPTSTAGPSVFGTTDTATTLSAAINENGTGYYLVQAAAAVAPSVATVQSSGTSFAMTANVAATPAISGLTASTAYKIYFIAKDAANNVQADVSSVAVTTSAAPDITAPTTTAAPSVSGTTDTATTLSVTINEAGTGYYLVQAAAAGAPNVAAVQAGTSFAMTANVAATPAISGLTAATAYKIYFVAKDVANNVQAAVSSVVVTTAAAPDTTPDVFTFVDQTYVARNALTESAAITVAGINIATAISVTGGEYQINGGAWTTTAGTVTNGQTAKVRHTSSAGDSTATNTVLTIGGLSDTFTSTTPPTGYLVQGGLLWMPMLADTWANANTYCTTTTINGQTGWRLPTSGELSGFAATATSAGWAGGVWSSTFHSAGFHYFVALVNGAAGPYSDGNSISYTCVR